MQMDSTCEPLCAPAQASVLHSPSCAGQRRSIMCPLQWSLYRVLCTVVDLHARTLSYPTASQTHYVHSTRYLISLCPDFHTRKFCHSLLNPSSTALCHSSIHILTLPLCHLAYEVTTEKTSEQVRYLLAALARLRSDQHQVNGQNPPYSHRLDIWHGRPRREYFPMAKGGPL